eukprot:TRINITY_DN10134_c0_g4_i1.p2 TRINITY_DN10134_c0_g4~~TRINITY_DN10134_c0_g4_i1.p2  ORF type:complete len:107 (+),score=3.14 TRINITY_DN10134_c0_g4_i1:350-670(+)
MTGGVVSTSVRVHLAPASAPLLTAASDSSRCNTPRAAVHGAAERVFPHTHSREDTHTLSILHTQTRQPSLITTSNAAPTRSRMSGAASSESSHVLWMAIVFKPETG